MNRILVSGQARHFLYRAGHKDRDRDFESGGNRNTSAFWLKSPYTVSSTENHSGKSWHDKHINAQAGGSRDMVVAFIFLQSGEPANGEFFCSSPRPFPRISPQLRNEFPRMVQRVSTVDPVAAHGASEMFAGLLI